jgi:hypothetical protein
MVRFKLWAQWALLPAALRRAAATAVLIIVASAALLYQTNVRADRPPTFSRGGPFAGDLRSREAADELTIPTPTPRALRTGPSRSSAVLQAPPFSEEALVTGHGSPRMPALGRYIYAVQGSEQATAFGSRKYPPEMTTTVHRTQPQDPGVPRLRSEEVIFDLYFSNNHEEREIVSYRPGGIVFTYEAGSVTFGPVTQTSEAVYDPPMLQISIPLVEGAHKAGTSRAINNAGEVVRTEDWTVQVIGRDEIDIAGEPVRAWVVQIDRQSRPGSREQVTRSRKYWFDPRRSLWVRWDEKLDGMQSFGPGSFTYHTQFTATLSRVEPLR